jgi:hypothetical protein
MTRPVLIPDKGDISRALVARRLGMTLADFEARRGELEARNFPQPDETSGLYCIEAVDRWRLQRFPKLFPELTHAAGAINADAVFEQRMRRFNG